MNEKDNTQYALDIISAYSDRTNKRMFIIIIAMIALICIIAVGILVYFTQFYVETTTTEYVQDGQGLNIIGDRNGAIFNGTEITDDYETPRP